MKLYTWTCLPVSAVLVLILVPVLVQARSSSAGRPDRTSIEDATVNATVMDRGSSVHMLSSEEGTYGQDSPKVDARGIVVTPAPHHGGTRLVFGKVLLVPGVSLVL